MRNEQGVNESVKNYYKSGRTREMIDMKAK